VHTYWLSSLDDTNCVALGVLLTNLCDPAKGEKQTCEVFSSYLTIRRSVPADGRCRLSLLSLYLQQPVHILIPSKQKMISPGDQLDFHSLSQSLLEAWFILNTDLQLRDELLREQRQHCRESKFWVAVIFLLCPCPTPAFQVQTMIKCKSSNSIFELNCLESISN
jgi:hypothetical protein